MSGLLDFLNTDEGRLGLGLLAAAGPRADGAGFGQRMQEGFGSMDAWKKQQLTQKLQDLQFEHMKKTYGREDAVNALGPKFYKAGTPGLPGVMGDAGLPPELQTGAVPMAATPEKPASFDLKGYSEALMGIDAQKGIALMQTLQKDTPFDKVNTDKFTPQSLAKFQTSRNYGDLIPRDKLEFVEGVGVNPFDPKNAGRSIPNPNKPFSLGANGEFVPNMPYQNYEFGKAKAGAAKTQNNLINAGPKAFDTELGKLDAEQLNKWRTGSETAQNTLQTVQNMRSAEGKGAYSGGTANARMAAANFVNGITGATPKGFVGSQLYNAETSSLVLDRIKMLGANPSNADRDFIEKTVPQLATSSEARKEMTDFMEKKATQAIDLYRRADSHARKNSGLAGFSSSPYTATDIDSLVNKYK